MIKKLGISESFRFQTYPYNPVLINIIKLVSGILVSYGFILSRIHITEYRKLYILNFVIFLSDTKQYNVLGLILKYLNPLLVLKFKKNVILNIKLAPSIFHDDNLLGSWFKYQLLDDPQKFRNLIKQVSETANTTINK